MNKSIIAVHDCRHEKAVAIEGVFRSLRPDIQFIGIENTTLKTSVFTMEALFDAALVRIRSAQIKKPDADFYATVQRGYIWDGNIYRLISVAAVSNGKDIVRECTSSISVDKKISDQKYFSQQKRVMDELLREHFPEWKKETSVFTILTKGKEDERLWMQMPLRCCLRTLLYIKSPV
ncbi:DUF84 family protein [Candidatus Nomurabacteria bacterium]|nr:DUF84 family protein [Candidatus Nomurabacteria bacterium]